MKNKKSLLGLVLVIMVLVLGVGYAVVTSVNLNITGTANTETKDLDVVISAANPNDTTSNTYGTVSNPVDTNATITVKNMTGLSDTRTVTYTVSNRETDLDAKVYVKTAASDITVSKSDYFNVVTSVDGVGNAITVPAGSTATFTVTVSLKKMPIESTDSSTDITIKLTADPAPKA